MNRRIVLAVMVAGAAASLGTGCATGRGIHEVRETRERFLYARDHKPRGRFTSDPEADGRRQRALAALNLSFEELSAQGFKLQGVQASGEEGGATKFTFGRRIPEGYQTTGAPMEFNGVFRRQDEGSPRSSFYVLDPIHRGYRVRILGSDSDETIEALWNGKELVWRDRLEEHRLRLSDDARGIVHTEFTLPAAGQLVHEPRIGEALRVNN